MQKYPILFLLAGTFLVIQPIIFNPQLSVFKGMGAALFAQSPAPGYKWAFNPGANSGDFGNAIAIDGSGNIYVTGLFQGTADFDPGPGTANLTTTANPETFVAKYNSAGSYVWAFNIQATLGSASEGFDIAVGAAGDVYITGGLYGTADFNPGAGTANLTSLGGRDIFIAKYNTNGSYQWAFNIGNTFDDYGYGIALDNSDNIHITGSYKSTVDFDPGAGTSNLSGLGGEDIFVAKYNASGTYQWAIGIPSVNSTDIGRKIAVDGFGNIFVTGYFRGPADFDPGAGTTTLTSNGQTDIFVAKYNSSGAFQWAFNTGSNTDYDYGQGITTDGSGNIVVTGYFRNSPDFDPGPGTATLSSSGWDDIFVAKYNSSGAYQWAFNVGSGTDDYGYNVTTDINGNIYITGYFKILADFDPGAPTFNLTGNGGADIYLAKYNSSGVFQWAFSAGSSSEDKGSDIVVDPNGNVFVMGTLAGTADFDPGSGTANLTPVGGYDCFIAKYCQVNPSITVTNTSCYGGSNGTATATPLDGSAPYTYLWSNSATQSNATGLMTGIYSVTVTDGTGCSGISTATISQPPDFNFGYFWKSVVDCYGSNDGDANISFVSGATPPYSYLWSNGETGSTIDSLFSGVYSVTITDSAGCDTTFSITITEPPDISYSVTAYDAACYGVNDGSITVNAFGGTGSLYFSVDSGLSFNICCYTVPGLSPGNYYVFIKDANNCAKNTMVSISEPAQLSDTYSSTGVSCYGYCDATASINVTGGILPYTYFWDNGSDSASAVGICGFSGSIGVTLTDANGCNLSENIPIGEPPAINLVMSFIPVSCNGGSDGAATVNASGGMEGFTYLWDNGQNSSTATGLVAGNYSVTVTDSTGCTAANSVTVTEPATLSLSMSSTSVLCYGGNSGFASVNVNGGNIPYTYQWSNNGTSTTITSVVANSYTVTVSDSKGCTAVNSISVTQPALLTGAMSKTDVSCTGFCDGTATVVASGGTAPYIYLWNPTNQTTSIATGLCPDNYTVNIADANNCQATPNIIISEPAPVTLTTSSTDATCSHSDGTASALASGGTPPLTYQWSNGDTSSTATAIAGGSYTVTVIDANGCDTVLITTVPVSAFPQDVCIVTVDSLTQKNLIVWQKTPGMGTQGIILYKEIFTNVYDSISYVPFDILSEYVDFASDPKTKAERYKIATMDSCGNISLLSDSHRTILLTASVGVNNERNLAWNDYEGLWPISQYRIWRGTAINNITLIDSVVYGTNLYADWDTLSGVDSLYYFVELVHPTGCTSTIKLKTYNASKSNTASMEAPSLPLAIIGSGTNISCNGGNDGTATATITGGEAPYTYLWDDSQFQTDSTATGLVAGNYNVTVTDNNNTTITGNVVIIEPAAIAVTASATDANSPGNDDGAIDINVSGGTPPYQFSWSNSATTEDIDSLHADTYTVVITDANNCQAVYTDTVKLVVGEFYRSPVTDYRLLVYPNPNNGRFVLSTNNESVANKRIYELRIMNILGEVVWKRAVANSYIRTNSFFVDLEDGIYALQVEADGEVVRTVRVVVLQ